MILKQNRLIFLQTKAFNKKNLKKQKKNKLNIMT